jgi:hypothetical protein
MEDRLWVIIKDWVGRDETLRPRQRFSTQTILLVGLWAILHDRPFCWACERNNWGTTQPPGGLPHPSTLSRRWRREDLLHVARSVFQLSVQSVRMTTEAVIDGKPIPVSAITKDPDARSGRGSRGFERGYKLHAVVSLCGIICDFEVTPLNVNERVPARRLLANLPETIRRVVADGNYDSGPLHEALVGRHLRLYTPIQRKTVSPKSHPRRKVLCTVMNSPFGKALLRRRGSIERRFAQLTNIGCGLKGLPNWVRRLHRVQRWLLGKILTYHAWLKQHRACA